MTKPTPPRTPSALKLHIRQAEWEQLYRDGLIQAKVKGTSKELDPVSAESSGGEPRKHGARRSRTLLLELMPILLRRRGRKNSRAFPARG